MADRQKGGVTFLPSNNQLRDFEEDLSEDKSPMNQPLASFHHNANAHTQSDATDHVLI